MNRACRNATRIRAELRKAYERARVAERSREEDEARVAQVLAVDNHRRRIDAHVATATPLARPLLRVVAQRAPSLLEPDYLPVLELVASLPHARVVDTWEPRAKGRKARLISLLEHLFATVPVPSVLWRGFFDAERHALAPLVVWVASGGSLHQYVKSRFAIPLTRKMCHVALAARGEDSLLHAMRRAQVLALGGDAALANAWADSVHASAIRAREIEAFFVVVLEWLAQREHRTADVPILIDYAASRFAEDPAFSMKGRTVEAFLRDARAWHVDLAKLHAVEQSMFRPSGFQPMELVREKPTRVVWRVEEILTAQDLFEEGRRMGHCVYSYAHAVESGSTSIWILTMEDGTGPTGRWAMLTVEVRNAMRAVVQARGRFNRMPDDEELKVLARWVASNGLTLAVR
jgi:hypothetical protein